MVLTTIVSSSTQEYLENVNKHIKLRKLFKALYELLFGQSILSTACKRMPNRDKQILVIP